MAKIIKIANAAEWGPFRKKSVLFGTMILLDISFYQEPVSDPEVLLKKHQNASGHFEILGREIEMHVVKFCSLNAYKKIGRVHYHFLKKTILLLPFLLKKQLNAIQPDIIIVHSFTFPLQTRLLFSLLNKRQKLLLQHHAEQPSGNILKKKIQKRFNPPADAYLFTSKDQAEPFFKAGYIRSLNLVHEVMEGSNYFDKTVGRRGKWPCFLWVGRLLPNKDPVCILNAFAVLHEKNLDFELNMIFSDNRLENEIRSLITEKELEKKVHLIGQVDYSLMPGYYQKAHYFVSGSHAEGSSWSLSEAMACACIPVVTAIPSFIKMCGETGYRFKPGKHSELSQILMNLKSEDYEQHSIAVRKQFENELSFEAIARQTLNIIRKIKEGN